MWQATPKGLLRTLCALGVMLRLVLSLALGVEYLCLVPGFVLEVVGGVFVGFGADGVGAFFDFLGRDAGVDAWF